ncbi:hypothetical protein BJ165DRAFT_1496634 [Panaeolus papilionaceus]|nr:hypothetical protein BJ165DRAFT_1496634 [Panaeolus papilionaceus]
MDMLDDDIVYLGSRNPQSPSTARPSSQSPLTGIVLHVEKCGLVEAQRLAFNRDDMPTVQIGRRSGFDSDRRRSSDIEQEGAMFRCAVVSRKHAKIAFSDSGAAYLIDLNSHHGTYIRRPDEKYSKVIKPESPTLLHDGDVVTFGKTVGKNEEAVRPVTVRVELVYQPAASSPSSSKPSSAASLFSASPSLSHSTVTKPSSGRYGVHNSASSSSDNESYSSDMYSDVDCARSISPTPPPPAEEPAPLPPSESQNSIEAPKAKVPFNAVNILRNLLPPLHPPPPRENLPSVADIMHRYFRPTPPLLSSLFDLPQPPRSGIEESQPIGFDASQHDIYEPEVQSLRSRSESPMDLASTSPSPAPEVIVSRQLSIPPILTPVLTPIPRRAIAIDLSSDSSNADQEKIDAYKPPFVNLVELYDLPGILSHPTSPGPSTAIADKDGVNGSGDVSDQIKVIQDTVARLEVNNISFL